MGIVVPGSSTGGGGGTGVFPGIAAPYPPNLTTGGGSFAVNELKGVRVVIPSSGTLRDISIFVGTQSGNVSCAIYNTANPRVRQSTSGAVACPASGAWRIIYDPAMVVSAGQQLDFVLTCDNATAVLGWSLLGNTGMDQLPANFLPGVGGAPWLAYSVAASHPAPASISEASFGFTSVVASVIGRIV